MGRKILDVALKNIQNGMENCLTMNFLYYVGREKLEKYQMKVIRMLSCMLRFKKCING